VVYFVVDFFLGLRMNIKNFSLWVILAQNVIDSKFDGLSDQRNLRWFLKTYFDTFWGILMLVYLVTVLLVGFMFNIRFQLFLVLSFCLSGRLHASYLQTLFWISLLPTTKRCFFQVKASLIMAKTLYSNEIKRFMTLNSVCSVHGFNSWRIWVY
jgi:hypothetical protein